MSIASAITAAQGKVAAAYTAISNKGGTLPTTQNLTNMPTAIASIPSGTTPTGTLSITTNGVYDVTNYASANVSVSGGLSGTATLTIESSNGGGAFSNSYILVNDSIEYYSSGGFPNSNISVTVPKGNVTVTCISYLGNYVILELGDGPLGTGTWSVTPDHDSPGDVAVVSKTFEITSDTTIYLNSDA